MFNSIADRYDFLNHFLSLGIDRQWRKRLVKEVSAFQPSSILDVATGTADVAIELSRLNPQSIIGIDISEKMLDIGKIKIKEKNLQNLIELLVADSEHLPFDSESFDLVTVAFGVRNFENLMAGLTELHRVLKPGAILAILEFSLPTNRLLGNLYLFYFRNFLPLIGRMISGNKMAYNYLPDSVSSFPHGRAFSSLLTEAGFDNNWFIPLTFGIATLYLAKK